MNQLTARVTPRKLVEPAPSREVIAAAIAAAEAAPDHGRLRPWRFIVLEGEARQVLGRAMGEALKQRDPATTLEAAEAESKKPLRAPLIIVVAAVLTSGHKVPEIEQLMAVAAAAQNLQLALHEAGFGVQWKTGPAAYDASVKQALGLAPENHIVGFMYAGTIAEPGRPRETSDGTKVRYGI